MTQGPEQVAEAMQQYETIDPSKIINGKDEVLNILQEYKKWWLTCSIKNDFFEFTKTDQNWQLETRYIRKERLDDLIRTDNAINDAGKDIEFLKNYISTKKALDNANKEVTWGNNKMTQYDTTQSESPKGNESSELYNKVDNANDQEELKSVIDEVIDMYKDLCKWVRGMEWNWKSVSEFRNWIKESIEELQKIRRDIKKHDYNNLSVYKWEVWKMIYYYDHYEQIRQLITIGETPDMFKNIHSKKDAEKALEDAERHMKSNKEMNELLHNTALISLWNDDAESYQQYLEAVINWQVEPSSHPFYKAHESSFYQLQMTNPSLYQRVVPVCTWAIPYETYCMNNQRSQNVVCRPKNFAEKIWSWLADIFERMNWISWDPRQRQWREKAWSLVAVWWALFLWFKFFQTLFKKKTDWDYKWWKVAWYWAWLLTLLNLDKVAGTFWDCFNIHPAERSRMVAESFKKYCFEDEEAMAIAEWYVWAPIAAMSALHFIPIYELEKQNILEEWKPSWFKFNYNNYENYINKFKWDNKQKKAALDSWRKLNENNYITEWLSWLGITSRSELKNAAWNSKTATLSDSKKVQNSYENLIEEIEYPLNSLLFNQKLKIKDKASFDSIKTECNEKWIDLNNLDVNHLSKEMKELIKQWIKDWKLESSSDTSYDIWELMKDYWDIIDLDNMTINWFTEWSELIEFDTYWELLDTVNLTYYILKHFNTGRDTKTTNPFHINTIWNIEFDNTEWYDITHDDIKIINGKTLRKSYPTIKNNKKFYVDYLNRLWSNESKVDLSSYPIVSNLWIDFFWENWKQEAHSLEIWMNEIKEWKKFSVPVENWQPFTVKWRFLNLWNDLVFTAINGNKEVFNKNISKEFPTIVKDEINRKKFENYLNDPQNQMWWSAIN